ncbi:hypothetical protein FCR2A7T_11340 [Flavobacterium cauense R2A-7]|uniref:Glycosyltransferase involved in cell wall biosynthesis n=1 Tax=Flavobacterium cauense R2A-7 TaxID=1341154 RepID=V6S332_9FLAO|nr:glycosyltransferase [Flavobacterium cauense]ESU20819.1 hypothetical protein FCR2A7T_11340 [Flavobacterium cauense R2A-7]KGO82815.1 hypothetical protein Q762_03390 [Flavobacterium cauense R2A-7]TWI12161.1 glycosyltransferase involved in cell wall biosynthesis [Flavobacterium cauense R2A-7]
MTNKPQNILFITWDGPQTSYMEGLFLPIFNEINKHTTNFNFHVLQFTWSDAVKIQQIQKAANDLGIHYTAAPIYRKPIAVLGSLWSVFKGVSILRKYIRKHKIDIVMPRSTMPAVMVNRLKTEKVKVLFDADGLPLEERVDFSGLSKTSKQYLWLKSEETKLLTTANGVITRSQKAIDIHLKTIGENYRDKFFVVFNGRNVNFFQPNYAVKSKKREALGFTDEDVVFVYCGSLGPQYGWEEMMAVFSQYHSENKQSKFLILTGNIQFANERIPEPLKNDIKVLSVPFAEVPDYLNVADVAFAIRKPTFSMQGVAPIKLGEYLLMGLPTIASAGIGDTEVVFEQLEECFLYQHQDENAIAKAVAFLSRMKTGDKTKIRSVGLHYFSLENSALSYIKALEKL